VGRPNSGSLDRIRWYALAVVLLISPVFVVVVFVGQQNGARPPWDTLFIAVAALMLAAASVFAALSIVMAMRHTAADAAASNPTPARLTGNLPLRVLGAGVLIGAVPGLGRGGRTEGFAETPKSAIQLRRLGQQPTCRSPNRLRERIVKRTAMAAPPRSRHQG
jgi:hypothetical protein